MWVARPVDLNKRRLDRLIAIVSGLSSKEPQNALLIQQQEGSAFMRTDTLRGHAVTVYRYGKTSLYWLDDVSKELRRFEGNSTSGASPVVVDLLELSEKSIVFPTSEQVIPVQLISEAYEAVTR